MHYDIRTATIGGLFKAPKLENVEDDQEVRNFIYSTIVFMPSTNDVKIQAEVTSRFFTRYWGMKTLDRQHIVSNYTPLVRVASNPNPQ